MFCFILSYVVILKQTIFFVNLPGHSLCIYLNSHSAIVQVHKGAAFEKETGPRRFSFSAPRSGSLLFSYEIIRPAPGPRGSPAPIHRMSSSDQPIRKQMQYGSMVDTSVPIPELSSYFLAKTTTMAK